MRREKRTKQVSVWVRPDLYEQLDLFRADKSNVISMSAYLAEVLEEHAAVRIVKQKISRRVGNQ